MKINSELIRELKFKNALYSEILNLFAARKNDSKETKIERLEQLLAEAGHPPNRSEMVRFFRELETAGCGTYVAGRHGHPSRFAWNVSLRSVGKAALGGDVEAMGPDAAEDEDELESSPPLAVPENDSVNAMTPSTAAEAPDSIEHSFVLRPDYRVLLKLPSNLTAHEAARFADFIRTLPFAPQ